MNIPLFGFGAKPIAVSWGNKTAVINTGVGSESTGDLPDQLQIKGLALPSSSFTLDANPHEQSPSGADLLKTTTPYQIVIDPRTEFPFQSAGWTAYLTRIKSQTGADKLVFTIKCPKPPAASTTPRVWYDAWRSWKAPDAHIFVGSYDEALAHRFDWGPGGPSGSGLGMNLSWTRGVDDVPFSEVGGPTQPNPYSWQTQAQAEAWIAKVLQQAALYGTSFATGVVKQEGPGDDAKLRNFRVSVNTFKSASVGADSQSGFWQGASVSGDPNPAGDATATVTIDMKSLKIDIKFEGQNWTGPSDIHG